MHLIRRALMLTAAAALSSTLAACNVDLTGITGSVQGNYSLRSINGYSMPYTFSQGQTLINETLTLNGDGSYTDISLWNDGHSDSHYGYYTSRSGSIDFTDQTSGFTYQGTVSGSVLTEVINGYTQRYNRN